MTADDAKAFETAERGLLDSFGLEATARQVPLRRLGGSCRVLDAGQGPPVLALHGAMTAGASWVGLAKSLVDHRFLMVDRPGCGLSPLTDTPITDLAGKRRVGDDLVADLLDGLGIDRAHLITNSLGGWYGLRSAAAHPTRIDRMVAMGYQVGAPIRSMPFIMRAPPPLWLLPKRPRMNPALIRAMLKKAGLRRAIETRTFTDPMVDYMVALFRHTDTWVNEQTSAPRPATLRGVQPDVVHDSTLLDAITAPVHIFWGDEDPFAGLDVAERLRDGLAGATLEVVDEAGHAPWIDQADRAAESVRRHLSG